MPVQTEPAPLRTSDAPVAPARSRAALTADPTLEVTAPDLTFDDVSDSVSPKTAPRRRLNLRRLILPVAAIVVVIAAVVGISMYREGQMYVSTENAQLTGTPIQIGSMNAGRVDSVTPTVGSTVHKGDTVAQVALPSQIGTAQNGQPKLGFLNAGDSTVAVQAPIDGVVLAVPTTPGATVQAGQALVTVVDPSQLWVNANIEETNVDRIKVGQPVTVHVDALNQDVAGRVESITPATAGSFSLLPTSNTSGNFTKVTQLVPVRISVNLGNQPVLLGSSAEVKIRVA
jgi:multidrug resistance efflux pump